jgi:DNA-directed RNA polymerase sigma subunit (sigma70/sigma32)
MRQLKITKTPTPTQQAEAALALQWLENQAVPKGFPVGLYAAEVVPSFRFILSLAMQYQNQGLNLAELVTAGHAAAVACIMRHGKRREDVADSWAWWVREEMLVTMGNKQRQE